MGYIESWEEFSKAAVRLYSQNPWKVRFVVKYRHCDGTLVCKMTDDKVMFLRELELLLLELDQDRALSLRAVQHVPLKCLKYQTDQLQDVKKLEKLSSSLMRNMVSKER